MSPPTQRMRMEDGREGAKASGTLSCPCFGGAVADGDGMECGPLVPHPALGCTVWYLLSGPGFPRVVALPRDPGPTRPPSGNPSSSGGRAGPSIWKGSHGGTAQLRALLTCPFFSELREGGAHGG